MKTYNLTIVLIVLISLTSCKPGNREPLKPTPSGAPGDLLLVVNDNIWEAAAGDTLRSMLAAPVEALPQNEPLFDVIRIKHSVFDKNFKTQRNIMVVKVGSDQPEPKIIVQKGLWARSQLLVGLQAANQQELLTLLNNNRDKIVSLFLNSERKRLMDAYHRSLDQEVANKLRDKYHIKLTVPVGYEIDVEEDDFVWLAQEYRDIIQGIFIYTYPYTDENTFTRDYLVDKRNEILKQHVPGEVEGSYMTTEPLFPPIFREYDLRNEKYTAELRGLWRMEKGLAMGGPFISITQLDEERNRVVTLDAFVFAPAHKKRDLLRQLEAIILTVEIIKDQKPAEKSE